MLHPPDQAGGAMACVQAISAMWSLGSQLLLGFADSLVQELGDGPPADGKEGSLHAVREDPRLEAPAEEPGKAFLRNDVFGGVGIAHGDKGRLPRGLQHPPM